MIWQWTTYTVLALILLGGCGYLATCAVARVFSYAERDQPPHEDEDGIATRRVVMGAAVFLVSVVTGLLIGIALR